MKKIVFCLFSFIIFIAAGNSSTHACSCLAPETDDLRILVKKDYKDSTAVFSGEVIEITKDKTAMRLRVKFRRDKSWKGGVPAEFTITTADNSAMCGYNFELGKKYLVYARGEKSALRAELCTRTAPLASNEDTKILDKLNKRKTKFSPK